MRYLEFRLIIDFTRDEEPDANEAERVLAEVFKGQPGARVKTTMFDYELRRSEITGVVPL